MSCPNDDPSFTTFLRHVFGHWATTPAGREWLFWRACVPFRFTLYTLFLMDILPITLARLGAALSLVHLGPHLFTTRQWWDRRIDAALSAVAVVAPASVIPWILFSSLVFGIVQVTRFC
jgi:hypothetical protein